MKYIKLFEQFVNESEWKDKSTDALKTSNVFLVKTVNKLFNGLQKSGKEQRQSDLKEDQYVDNQMTELTAIIQKAMGSKFSVENKPTNSDLRSSNDAIVVSIAGFEAFVFSYQSYQTTGWMTVYNPPRPGDSFAATPTYIITEGNWEAIKKIFSTSNLTGMIAKHGNLIVNYNNDAELRATAVIDAKNIKTKEALVLLQTLGVDTNTLLNPLKINNFSDDKNGSNILDRKFYSKLNLTMLLDLAYDIKSMSGIINQQTIDSIRTSNGASIRATANGYVLRSREYTYRFEYNKEYGYWEGGYENQKYPESSSVPMNAFEFLVLVGQAIK